MIRARPGQHTRRLKSGRVIKVNKGVRKAKRRMASVDDENRESYAHNLYGKNYNDLSSYLKQKIEKNLPIEIKR